MSLHPHIQLDGVADEYERTLRWLYGLEARRGMDFGLERVERVLARLGDPHRRLAVVHIAGTNGKGSVAAMLEAVLSAAGYRVGLYTSPHLERFTERIRIGREEIAPARVVELARRVWQTAEAAGVGLTFFELTTVMAFLVFAEAGVDVAVVEVGLGGRLDATNVVDPLVSVITTIGDDHHRFLGGSLRAVAAEKGGIIKPWRPVVLGRIRPAAARVLRARAVEREAPVWEAGRDWDVAGERSLSFRSADWSLDGIESALAGRFQRDNVGTALAALGILRPRFPMADAVVREALGEVCWPGRFEVLAGVPPVVLDAAHNPDGMRVLREELDERLPGRPRYLLFAAMRDKRWRRMIDIIAPGCRSVVVTRVLPPRGCAPEMLARRFAGHVSDVDVEADPERAWERVCGRARSEGVVVVTGSLFLIGAVRRVGGEG